MHNLWLEFLVGKFADKKQLRCCGSCQGGFSNPSTCIFMCLGYTVEDIENFYNENKEALEAEFEKKYMEE
ncbi:MAG: hypothetical protein J6Z11_17130 [Candidatus Riflebacteria bacterium]|nr:hypothetical protein [Candidatus Riflebacteria bacterium]